MDQDPGTTRESQYTASDRLKSSLGIPSNRLGVPAVGLFAILFLALAFSCAQTGSAVKPSDPTGNTPPAASRTAPAPASKASEGPLASLPAPARDFLTELRDHLRRGDFSWAAERADPSFLRAMEGRGRDSYFYTYLFSAGPLARETPEYGRFETLPVARVRDMVWEEARIEGPAVIVLGRFILSSGAPVPFALRLLWRLDPPRILGVQP